VIEKTVKAASENDNKSVVLGWKRIRQLDAVKSLDFKQYIKLSEYISRTFKSSWTHELFDQERYTIFEDIAVQAAARDAWRGLYTLSIAALRNNHPATVANAFERYKLAIYDVQGKTRSGHIVRDKVARMEARLDGYGLQPLTFVYLFSMMRLNQINGKVIMNVFDTRRPIFNAPQKLMDTILGSVLPALRSTERPIVQREFYRLIDTGIFILSIWHPQALLRTMRDLDFNQDWAALGKLYNRFLYLSVGPNKLVHAYDLNERDRDQYDEVPFTTAVWREFLSFRMSEGDG
jgi:hypothetical protein